MLNEEIHATGSGATTISITVPTGISKGILIASTTAWSSETVSVSLNGDGISSKQNIYNNTIQASCRLNSQCYFCELNAGQQINLTLYGAGAHIGYSASELILIY